MARNSNIYYFLCVYIQVSWAVLLVSAGLIPSSKCWIRSSIDLVWAVLHVWRSVVCKSRWPQLGNLDSLPHGLSSSSRQTQTCSHGAARSHLCEQKHLRPLEASELAQLHLHCILLAKANHQEQLQGAGKQTQYLNGRSCKVTQQKRGGEL